MATTRTLVIEIDEKDNYFTVRDGDRYAPGLCWDEMLGTIAELTHPAIGAARYRMSTVGEWATHNARRNSAAQPVQAQPPLSLPAPSAI